MDDITEATGEDKESVQILLPRGPANFARLHHDLVRDLLTIFGSVRPAIQNPIDGVVDEALFDEASINDFIDAARHLMQSPPKAS